MKGQGILDAFNAGIVFIAVAFVFVVMAVLWHQGSPQLVAQLNQTNPNEANTIINLGNGFYYHTADTLMVVFYFILILASFIAAYYEGADGMTLPIGIALMVLAIIVSFPISDFAHGLLASTTLYPVNLFFSGTLYIFDNLPIFTGIAMIGYLVFVTTKKADQYGSAQGYYSG
jgi:hypothetical protein